MPWNLGLAWADGELATFRIFWFPAIFETACVLSCLKTTQEFKSGFHWRRCRSRICCRSFYDLVKVGSR